MGKKVIVISGINLVDGGPISVYFDFLSSIVENGYNKKNRIIALVGKKELFSKFEKDIEFMEFRKSKSNWIYRLYYEYIIFNKLSKQWDVDIWISMHDITPNVKAKKRYVYCHNPSPFNKMQIKEIKFGLKYYLFSKFYKYLYAINIKKNNAIIVQQEWIRREFMKMYHLKNIIVARPSIPKIGQIIDTSCENDIVFVCPSFPRYYKNFQVICEAVKKLENDNVINFKLFITLDGTENKYSLYLKEKYGNLKNVFFCGLLPRNELFKLYGKSNCLIFISKLETWGMPITEFKTTGKAMIVADLPYAYETVGEYSNVAFVKADDSTALASIMRKVIEKEKFKKEPLRNIVKEPYAENWTELCELLFT